MRTYRVTVSMLLVSDSDPDEHEIAALMPDAARLIDVEFKRVPRDPADTLSLRREGL